MAKQPNEGIKGANLPNQNEFGPEVNFQGFSFHHINDWPI